MEQLIMAVPRAFGTIYCLKPNGSEFYVLHNFAPETDGYCLRPGLVVSGNTFYGATGCGGISQQGVIFALTLVPRFISATALNGGLSLMCNVIPGHRHSIQYASDPTSATWQDLGEPFLASHFTYQTFHAFGPDTRRLYRIEMLPSYCNPPDRPAASVRKIRNAFRSRGLAPFFAEKLGRRLNEIVCRKLVLKNVFTRPTGRAVSGSLCTGARTE